VSRNIRDESRPTDDKGSPQGPPELALRDPWLRDFAAAIARRAVRAAETERLLAAGAPSLLDFASGHEYYGLHRKGDGWLFREWAPNAARVCLVGDFNGWAETAPFTLRRINENGDWEVRLPVDAVAHGQHYKLKVYWPAGGAGDPGAGDRIPAYARRVVQNPETKIFSAQVWEPPAYRWKHPRPAPVLFTQTPSPQAHGAPAAGPRAAEAAPRIYEVHVGMAQEKQGIGTYDEFRERILPRVVDAGYNVIQLMAVQEHPYYGSFGYHVSSFFAASSRFGTPEELKALVDAAHGEGLSVVMDLVHSHAVMNEAEGLSRFDGTLYQYFHAGPRGYHAAWDSRCFDYGRIQVLHFLLSNCRFWLDEYNFDGFRFDGVTSMLYLDHGLGKAFTGYGDYFDNPNIDEDALTYLALANRVVHDVRPGVVTIAEDVSGMPGLAAPQAWGGTGFDYRLAMGVPDYWIKLTKDVPDERWHMGGLYHELTNRRGDEKTISYAESHDQALVGDKTLVFRMIDKEMYWHMGMTDRNLVVERGVALHKMIRLATLSTAGHGYLNFMGNEFGHPEWIDFPRAGNGWSYAHARRQWHLRDDPALRYALLAAFDKAMMALEEEHRFLGTPGPRLLLDHEERKLLIFERAGLLFLFNFHPLVSCPDLAFEVPAGRYRLALDSDAPEFGGHGRVAPGQVYAAEPYYTPWGKRLHRLRVYLPCRAAIVLARSER
jgi:1,4-alpha-glucan branching enzyme